MQRRILPEADKYTKQNHRRRAWQKIVRVMACVVVFCTTYALILPAITMEKPTNCGLEEHVHSEECYEKVTSRPVTELACTYETLGIHQHDEKCRDEEENLICDEIDFIVHEHDESCVDESGELVCQLPEIKEHAHTEECWHTHTEACYTTQQGELICQTEESEDHQHTQDCYEQTQVFICELAPEAAEPALICQEPEIQLHTHGADCYRLDIAEDGTETTVLTCTKQEVLEHVHSEACFQTVEIPMEDVDTLTCGLDEAEAHAHTERCYGTWEMTCGYEVEHTHTLECHADKTADLETEETWTANLPQTLTGNWAEDLLAVAKTQVGYSESKKNYIVEADGETVSGYNRYGAWYASVSGDDSYAYAPWNVTFLFFDLYHAGINFTDFPYEETCPEWINALNSYGLYRAAGEYTPAEGDLVFVDTDGDGEADRVGVASEVEDNKLIAIEGDYEGAVAEVTYALPELTVEPETTETSETTETEDGTEMDVSVSQSPVMLLSDGTDEGDEVPQPTVVGYADMAQAQADAQPENGDVSMLLTWDTTSFLYLDISTYGWATYDAHIVLAYYDGDNDWSFSEMTHYSDTLYQIELPDNMVLDNGGMFEFVRMDDTGTFSWNNRWNRTGSNGVYHTLQSGTNVFKLNGWDGGAWESYVQQPTNSGSSGGETGEETDTLPELKDGCRRVFYDATLSKLSYAGDSGSKGDYGIPKANSNVIYCWADKQYTMTKLTNYTKDGHTYTDVYYVDIPSNCTTVTFASFALTSATNYGGSGESTTNLTIPSGYAQPCFYADSSDQVIYSSYEANVRGGYWGEAFTVRDAEKGKGTDVVDIKNTESFAQNSTDTLYLSTTFFDYYTDYELNGNNRDKYNVTNGMSQRNWVTFRQLNQALSDSYESKNVNYPLYVGHFQPNVGGDQFSAIASTLDLYGYSNYNRFFASNNSILDEGGTQGKSAFAMQGLVNSTLVNDSLMASGGTLEFPLFDKDFITGNNSKNTKLGEVYEYVSFPFTKVADTNGIDYWTFDSSRTTLAMQQDKTTGEYYLKNVENLDWSKNVNSSSGTNGVSNTYGFFPFNATATTTHANTYNYGFGTRIDLKFRLTSDGTVKNGNGTNVPIKFEFSGDDDVWVFIDGNLALDIGGAHGRVTGTIDFSGNTAEKSAKVSKVKYGGSAKTEFPNDDSPDGRTTNFQIEGDNTDEHTLTMFYMERGMWESNMKITFNFPDENLLEVKKEVDTTKVNSLFDGVFEDKSLFTFNIKNLATHYGAVSVEGSNLQPVTLDTTSASNKVSLTAYGSNIFDRWKLDAFNNDDSVVHWYAKEYDTSSDYREKRYGTMWLNTGDGSPNIVDLSKMSYMEFEVYFQDATPSLSKMYIQLKDTSENVLTKADSSKPYLSSSVYGSVSPQKNQWFKVRLSLSDMLASSVAEGTRLGYIRFGYDEPVNIFLRGFKFLPAVSASENNVGFVKQQDTIPDYGSAKTGILKPATGAVYSSDKTNALTRSTLGSVDTEGNFVLSKDETATFYNQFRRGSYIALQEIVSSDLFETKWTMYENSKPVTSMGNGSTVTNGSVTSLNGVSSTAVEDGRTEKKDDDTIEDGYDGNKPNENTFVFRSYVSPDNTTSATKLKVVFTNKVKTGSLTITKQDANAGKETGKIDTDEKFTFYVVFTNVGGMSLESAPIVAVPITLSVGKSETISGIPINTEYAVYEIKSENADITLDHITDDVYKDKYPYEVTTYKVGDTDKVAYMASGVIDDETNSDGKTNNVTYYNIQKEVVSLTLTKVWDSVTNPDTLPTSIKVQLQCSTDGGNNWVKYNDYYEAKDIGPGYESWDDYTFEFTNLDKYDADGKEYKYRVVELNSEGDVITSTNDKKGELDIDGTKYEVTYGTVENVEDEEGNTIRFTQTITNKWIPTGYELPETGGAGTYLYTLGGIVLTAVPLVYGYSQWRRRERRAAR